MRYTLESTLPIDAFKPRAGRSPFSHGMTLEGGGGGAIGNALGSVAKGVTDVVKGVVQPVYNATLKQIPGVDNALVNLDKSVGKAIPGGWGTVASVAASFIPGGQLAALSMTPTGLATGLGALTGSGVMRGNHQFNLQGAIMGGAMAYGASQLSNAFQNAGKELAATPTGATTDAIANSTTPTANVLSKLEPIPVDKVGNPLPVEGAGAAPNFSQNYTPTPSQSFSLPESSDYGLKNVAANPSAPMGDYGLNPNSVPSGLSATPPPSTLDKIASGAANVGKGTLSNIGDFGSGIAKVLGGSASLPSGTVMSAGIPLVLGASGMSALEEQQKYLDQQKAAGNIAQSQYDAESAKIADQIATAKSAVESNPLQAYTDTSGISKQPTLYAGQSNYDTLYDKNPAGGTQMLYAMGGSVSNPPDDQTGMPNQSPLTRFEQGGIMGLAAGGMAPRFLSGGGDGMSDSIPASIGGHQEARLADGEFVVPADVVSHLGNGSSKAGAKQLYSMMDKVRQARTGRKSQGKQINPRKYMPV